MKNFVRTPTFAVDGHMTLMDPWRGQKSLSSDSGMKVSMTCGGEGMEGTCDIDWAEELFFWKRSFGSKFGECRKYKKSWECVSKNVVRTPTFAVDGHMTLMDPCRGKKSLSSDGGMKVSMTCDQLGRGTSFLKKEFWVQVW